MPCYPATTSITIPEDIPPSCFAISRLVLSLRTSSRQSGACFCLETCWVRLGPAWPVPLEPRRCLGRGGGAMRSSCARLGSLACRCYFAVDINSYCLSESFTNWLYGLIYGLRRSFILLHQEIIVRYGGHLVIAPRMSGRWVLLRYFR